MFSSKKSTTLTIISFILIMFGLSYGSVPLYQIFCQTTGLGGTTQQVEGILKGSIQGRSSHTHSTDVDDSNYIDNRMITVNFTADVANTMPWKFEPLQKEVKVLIGETALIFYKAENPTNDTIIGVSTYNVNPPQVGVYFNKIQCFCFEEQRLKSHESIDMPVFFFLDPEMLDDPLLSDVDNVTLSYTFFKVEE